ncbi:alpha/beta hydrolase-fold protein [Flavobacterium sp. HXWNR69]|uniref:Alpha/beta hydrolase-fold protein n=1 Tax=Flavobacterium fragile TaxID=2949085 RepID=A0ABT0TF77_9FLAO|nr:alpha/beta hydrolase-fold protein [Flavobacterium sp. HXWNR69]MCL9769640.1 alpha/beta hydrolase-fold protein [Flavobacterium sp. HXWNR69]
MKLRFLIISLFALSITFAQRIPESIESKKIGTRTFTVITPPSYESNPGKRYPTLVVLDGEYLLDPFDGILKYGSYWDDLPEMILIGINQNYSETRFADSEFDEAGFPAGSGADFFEFIGQELYPYIDKKYRTLPFRMIAGHDTTAGFLNFYLYKDNPIFNAYISLAPEMAPEMEKRIAERLTKITKPLFYYQATGEGDLKEINEKAAELDANIKAIPNATFKYQNDTFKGASHYTLVAKAVPNAIYFIFDGYQPISMVEFEDKILKLDAGYTDYLIAKYDELEKRFGFKMKPRLSDFKAIEAAILKNKAYNELMPLSDYANKHYPKTTLGTYHEALYYEKTGNYKKAIKSYQKAFTQESIREITKDFMMNRAEALKGKPDEPTEDLPVETPTEKQE